VEVQVAGDGSAAIHLWERECSVQRRRQKLVEVAPAPALDEAQRQQLLDAAVTMAAGVRYDGLGTFEFLVRAGGEAASGKPAFAFIEANPRLQVEHTVTEEVTGLDLVRLQLELAAGRSLADLGLTQEAVPAARGVAIQARVNTETMGSDGTVRPTAGTLRAFEVPTGPG